FWTSHQDFDIRQPETKFCGSQNISSWIKQNHIHAIVNCAAYTQVDLAEQHQHEAFAVNADGVACLANIAQQFHLRLIHISTDYVFDGKKTRRIKKTMRPIPSIFTVQAKEQEKKPF
ncbi:MAG: sugar nucleotide-binding protein, partial [Neisseriaceae bacterium]|nr:sugar nucleotide-binding protein [Neisseriaceae bacterium]